MDRKDSKEADEWLSALLDEELVATRVFVREADVVFLKSILEASEGLGAIFAEPRAAPPVGAPGAPRDGGALVIAAPRSRAQDLALVLSDLRAELDFGMWDATRPETDG